MASMSGSAAPQVSRGRSVVSQLRLRARDHPECVPLTLGGDESLTYADWDRRSGTVAQSLLQRGVRPGDRIMLLFGGVAWLDYAVAYLGVLRAGATAVHVSDQEEDHELRRRIGQTAPAGIVHRGTTAPPADFSGWTAVVADLEPRMDPVRAAQPLPEIEPEAIADILYTSGTTGSAKPFAVPHGNHGFALARNAQTGFGGGPPMLAPMPLGTTNSVNIVGTFALTTTSTILVCAPDDVEQVAALIERHRPRMAMLPPWVAIALVDRVAPHRFDLSSVTTIGTASAPMPAPTARKLLAMMPRAEIHLAYAQSEAVPAIVAGTCDPDRPRCLGRPGPGTELRVARPDGTPADTGELGEIWLRSAAPKRLYLDPRLNEQAYADGWLRTRDLGHLDEDGLLHLFDRQADVIHTGSGPVSSLDVEDVLYAHPAVREAAVVGAAGRDPAGAPEVVAFVAARRDYPPAGPVVPVPGHPNDLTVALRDFAAQRLAPHQVPVEVRVVPSLPRGVTGKVRKHLLRERSPAGR